MTEFGKQKKAAQRYQSFWSTSVERESYPPMQGHEHAEVAVIGAGMVGILAAWELARRGRKVVLVEAARVADGVSAYTTAKITSQHSLLYQDLMKYLGKEEARLYFEANQEGIDYIKHTAEELQIDCDLQEADAVVYATSAKGKNQVLKEVEAYQKLGIEGYYSTDIPDFPDQLTAAIGIPQQAQFHPVKFLLGVLNDFVHLGGRVYEQTRATEVGQEEQQVIYMENGSQLHAQKVILATHYPINDADGLYFARLKATRSYGVMGKPTRPLPKGMYITTESPTRSFRTVRDQNGEEQLLIIGDSHWTGRDSEDSNQHYANLKKFGEEHFGITEWTSQWSTQDLTTPDQVPYIGKMNSTTEDIFVATGFNKWGMAQGALAGRVLCEFCLGMDNRYAKLFAPTRTHLNRLSLLSLAKENSGVAKELIGGKVAPATVELSELGLDEGGLVKVQGDLLGIYKDPEGNLYHVTPTCTHMGCTVNWNNAEKTWDCPCHGSRFSYTGDVLEGPAVRPLKKG